MHRKALVGRRARDGSRYKGEGRESGRGSPLWRLIMQSLATRAIEDKMLSHIRPNGKVSRSWDRRFPLSWLSRDRFCRDNRGRPRQTVPRVLNQSSFRGQIPRKTCTPRRKRKRNGGGGLCADGIPHPRGGGRWKVSRIGHRDTLTTLVERIGIALTSIYTVTPLLLFLLFFFLQPRGPPSSSSTSFSPIRLTLFFFIILAARLLFASP